MGKKPTWMSKAAYEPLMESFYGLWNLINSLFSTFVLYNILTTPSDYYGNWSPVVDLFIIMWGIPLILVLLLSPSGAIYYMMYVVPYILQVCQYAYLVPAFAYSRLNDFSWGNRDAELSHDIGLEEARKKRKSWEFFWVNVRTNVTLIIINILVYICYLEIIRLTDGRAIVLAILIFLFISPAVIQISFAFTFIALLTVKSLFKYCRNLFFSLSKSAASFEQWDAASTVTSSHSHTDLLNSESRPNAVSISRASIVSDNSIATTAMRTSNASVASKLSMTDNGNSGISSPMHSSVNVVSPTMAPTLDGHFK